MPTPNIKTASILTSGGIIARTLDARFTDILNVKDFGAVGNNTADDAFAIQACFDAAFGSSASPHGLANAHLNKPVFFPCGSYKVGTTLSLTRVVGGLIFGGGLRSTSITGSAAALAPCLNINGMASTMIRGIQFVTSPSAAGAAAVNLDWDNTSGGDGLNNNTFFMYGFDGDYGMIVADTGNGGAGTEIIAPTGSGNLVGAVGVDVRGSGASVQILHSSMSAFLIGFKVRNGAELCVMGGSCDGSDAVFDIGSANTMAQIVGMRTESSQAFEISDGLVHIIGVNHTVSGTFANITGGKVIIESSYLNQAGTGSVITGNGGSLYFRGNLTDAGYLAGYSGTVVEDV